MASLLDLFASLDGELTDRLEWRRQAACRGRAENFFPGRGESAGPARAVCIYCPVRIDCLRFALEQGEENGIWGGTTEKERRGMVTAVANGARLEDFELPRVRFGCGCEECNAYGDQLLAQR